MEESRSSEKYPPEQHEKKGGPKESLQKRESNPVGEKDTPKMDRKKNLDYERSKK